MKTIEIFGKKVALPLVIVAAVLAVGAMAAVVSYLSNTTTVTVSVDSPLHVQSYDSGLGAYVDGPVNIPNAYGGENIQFYTQAQNLANANIDAHMNTTVTNNIVGGASCYDFSTIDITVVETGNTTRIWDAPNGINLACSDNGNQFTVWIPATYIPLETEHYRVDAKFVSNVDPADYTFTTQASV